MTATPEVIAAAESYMAKGWSIVAVRPNKAPWGDDETGENWRRKFDEAEIIDRLNGWRCVAIGFLGGALNSNIVPLDFDTEAAERWWREQHEARGLDPDDYPTVITPGKIQKDGTRKPGRHRYVTDTRSTLGNAEGELRELGINVRGKGHAMLPPSPHPDGGTYRWVEGRSLDDFESIPSCPDFVYDAVEAKTHKGKGGSPTPISPADDSTRSYCRKALDNEIVTLARTLTDRNIALNNAALKLGSLHHHGAFTEAEVLAALRGACERNGLIGDDGVRAFEATFKSGWAKGTAEPRTIEPREHKTRANGAEKANGKASSDSAVDSGGVIARLAKLTELEYDRVREAEAKTLGIRVKTLDRLVSEARGKSQDAESDPFDAIDPWPGLVEGADLLDHLATLFARHLILPPGAADAMALWVLHAHAHDIAAISPILAITSPTPECGKTTALTLLGALVPRPLTASNITAAALFRAVEKWTPTLLVDEADTFLANSDELRGIINSGHNRGAAFVIRTVGEDHEPRRFKTWAPKVIALIGALPATLASRSIHIEMKRLAPGETVHPVRPDRLDHLVPFAQKAARWATASSWLLRESDPAMPPTLTGRRADNWRPMFVIADSAGLDWPSRARNAAMALTAGSDEQAAGVTLLSDIRDIMDDNDKVGSKTLAEKLGAMIDRPWPEWKNGKPITERGVAKLLEPFGIRPKTIRIGETTAKGYLAKSFEDAWVRYLPPNDPSHSNK